MDFGHSLLSPQVWNIVHPITHRLRDAITPQRKADGDQNREGDHECAYAHARHAFCALTHEGNLKYLDAFEDEVDAEHIDHDLEHADHVKIPLCRGE